MKQPDRFAQKVALLATDGWSADAWCISDRQAIACLRGEHAAMVRAVKKMMRDQTKWESHYLEACHDMLALLAQRRKGKK